jgi:anti-sigma regulatory factor (Ser/Thr protein kinase)
MTEFTAELPRDRTSIRTARRLVAAHAAGLSDAQLADACLMVSELVTNALVHGSGAIGLRIATAPDRVMIEVADDGNGDVNPAPAPAPGPGGGWGLRVVDELADRWGAREGSTRVWFELAAQGQRARRS